MESLCPLALRLPHSYALWSTRQQQYYLALQMRDLLKQFAPEQDLATPSNASP